MYKNLFESYSISEITAIEIALKNDQIEYIILNQFGVGGTDGTMIQVEEEYFEKANNLLIELEIRNRDYLENEVFGFISFFEKMTNKISILESTSVWVRFLFVFFLIFSLTLFSILYFL